MSHKNNSFPDRDENETETLEIGIGLVSILLSPVLPFNFEICDCEKNPPARLCPDKFSKFLGFLEMLLRLIEKFSIPLLPLCR